MAATAKAWIQRLEALDAKVPTWHAARRALSAHVGALGVRRYLETYFAMILAPVATGSESAFHTQYSSAAYADSMAAQMDHERARIEGRIALQDELHVRASRGELAVVGPRVRSLADYATPTPGLDPALVEHDRAAQWIAGRDHLALVPTYRAVLHELPLPLAMEPPGVHEGRAPTASSFGSLLHLVAIHGRVFGPSRVALRVGQAVNYPSTIGGEALVDRLFARTTIPDQSMEAVAFWTNWGMYFAASIAAAQAFSDGNKRTVHTFYAIVLLRTIGRFVAPTTAMETQLYAME